MTVPTNNATTDPQTPLILNPARTKINPVPISKIPLLMISKLTGERSNHFQNCKYSKNIALP